MIDNKQTKPKLNVYYLILPIFITVTAIGLYFTQYKVQLSKAATPFNFGILSDSSSDEYRADDNRGGGTPYAATTLSWDELLVKSRELNLGVWGSRSEPRRSGYEYNWARSGAEAHDLITSGAAAGIAQQTAEGRFNVIYFNIGTNDFAYYRDGADIYNGAISGASLDFKINNILNDISSAIGMITNANPNVNLLVGTIGDMGSLPNWQAQFPDPAKRQLVTDAINRTNDGIIAMAATTPQITIFDSKSFQTELFSRVDANGNLQIKDQVITFTSSGDEPHHAILSDGIHSGTVLNGYIANIILRKLNVLAGTTVPEFNDDEILQNAGIIAAPTSPPPPTQPQTITLTKQVSSSTDDTYQKGTNNFLTSSSIQIGGNTSYYAGMRFNQISIPKGAQIQNAYIDVYNLTNTSSSIAIQYYAENRATSSTFSNTNNPSTRPGTVAKATLTTSTNWPSRTWQRLGSLTSSVQEVINRSDWISGNSMSIIIRGNTSSTSSRSASSYNGSTTNAPKLTIQYIMPTTQPADTVFPNINVFGVSNGTTVSGLVSISSSATDNIGIASHNILIDNTNVQTCNSSLACTYNWNTANVTNGSHIVKVTASDAAGNLSTQTITVTVSNQPVSDTTAPVVSVSGISTGATVSGTVNISSTATDNVGIVSHDVLVDSTIVKSCASATMCTYSWNTNGVVNGSHNVKIEAKDAAGNIGNKIFDVIVNNTTQPAAKSIRIVSKPNSATQNYTIVDGIIEDGVQTESTSSRLTYSSGWATYPSGGRNNSVFRYTTSANQTVDFSTTASSLSIMAVQEAQVGSMDIYVNGTFVKTFNAYSSSTSPIYVDVSVPLN